MAVTKTETDQAYRNFAESLGVAADAMDEFVQHWRQATEALTATPSEELKWRLNAQLQGEDPGQPVNWRGLG